MPKMAEFSTRILDKELARRRGERESLPREALSQAFSALSDLSGKNPFQGGLPLWLGGQTLFRWDASFFAPWGENFLEAMRIWAG